MATTSEARPIWKHNEDLMIRLRSAQSALGHIDIMTFAGMCDSRAELLRHVEANEDYAARKGSAV